MGFGDGKMDQDLLEIGIIYLCGDLNHGKAAEMGKAITWLNRPVPGHERKEEILLYIDSSEGQITAALDMFDIIRFSEIPVTGIVYQQARHAAAMVLLACHKRVAMQHALIQFNPVKVTDLTFKDIEGDLDKRLKNARDAQDACIRIVAERTSHRSLEDAWAFIKSDSTLTADDALGEDIVDDVLYTAPTFMPYFSEQVIKRENRQF